MVMPTEPTKAENVQGKEVSGTEQGNEHSSCVQGWAYSVLVAALPLQYKPRC